MVFALKIWRHYLYGVHYTNYKDHKILRYLMDQLNLNMRKRRWLDVVKDYKCEILYHLDTTNVVDDTLSRRVMSAPNGGLCMRVAITSPLLGLVREA